MIRMRQAAFRTLWALSALVATTGALAQQRFIVTSQPADAAAIAERYRLTTIRTLDSAGAVQAVVAWDPFTAAAFLAAAPLDPSIRKLEPDRSARVDEASSAAAGSTSLLAAATDPLVPGDAEPVDYFGDFVRKGYAHQSASVLLNLPGAQEKYPSGGGIVAVIDTGVDALHPMLQRWLVPGYDFVTDQPGIPSELADVSQSTVALLDQSRTVPLLNKQFALAVNQSTVALLDQSTVALLDTETLGAAFGHGTLVAGLVHLVAPTARIMPLRAFLSDGSGNISDVVRAIYYATDHGARVINMSFSMLESSPALYDAIQYASSRGAFCVSSAGNGGARMAVYPASYRHVTGVASTNRFDMRSMFSNYGTSAAEMAAPGEALITAYPGGNYAAAWGTSFSTALVSGAAALIVALDPFASIGRIDAALDRGKVIAGLGVSDARLDVRSSLDYYVSHRTE